MFMAGFVGVCADSGGTPNWGQTAALADGRRW